MKKRRRIASILCLLVIFTLLVAIPASADDISEPGEIPVIQRQACVGCSYGTTYVCYGNKSPWETGTHSYDFWTKTCTFTDYRSYGKYVCFICKGISNIEGPHWCWRVHNDCGSGKERVCICEVKDTWD